jgi:small subunit ribosomal protein S6
LEHAFKFNDAVLRHLTIKMDGPMTEPSPMMREEKPREERPRPVATERVVTEEAAAPGA